MTDRSRESVPVITVDGPSGSGKGTVSRLLARELGFHFLDSGALYRVLALAAHRLAISLDDEARLADLAARLDVRFPADVSDEQILLDGRDVNRAIRSEAAGAGASRVAVLPSVRTALLGLQRGFARPPGLVADGRDMGTVVFPGAVAKVFLTASSEERAKRRVNQLKNNNIKCDYQVVLQEIRARDERDSQRTVAPLKPAIDAKIVDSTNIGIAEVVTVVREFVKAQLFQ